MNRSENGEVYVLLDSCWFSRCYLRYTSYSDNTHGHVKEESYSITFTWIVMSSFFSIPVYVIYWFMFQKTVDKYAANEEQKSKRRVKININNVILILVGIILLIYREVFIGGSNNSEGVGIFSFFLYSTEMFGFTLIFSFWQCYALGLGFCIFNFLVHFYNKFIEKK